MSYSRAKHVALVCGASRGIGLSAVRQLIRRGFNGDVILTSRDETRGRAALAHFEETRRPKYHALEVNDPDSIERLKTFLARWYGGLDVLINCASVHRNASSIPYGVQVETAVRTDFFGGLHVSRVMLPFLRAGARVVHLVAPEGHINAIPDSGLRQILTSETLSERELVTLAEEFVTASHDDVAERMGWCRSPYVVSKVLLAALTRVQQRALDQDRPEDDVLVNCVCSPATVQRQTAQQGLVASDQIAETLVHLALLPRQAGDNPRGEAVGWDRSRPGWTDNLRFVHEQTLDGKVVDIARK